MKRRSIVELKPKFDEWAKVKTNFDWAYFIACNKDIITKKNDIYNELRVPSEKYLEFDRKRAQLVLQLCARDDKGVPVVNNGMATIPPEKINEYNDAITKLTDEYKDTIEEYEKKIEEYETFLDEDEDIEFEKISKDVLKKMDTVFDGNDLIILKPFITE